MSIQNFSTMTRNGWIIGWSRLFVDYRCSGHGRKERSDMSKQEIVKIFGDRKIRSVWDDEAEKWYFSIVDVVAVLTESENPRNYWKVLKNRLKKEGNQTVTNCNQLKLRAEDGKMRMTDVADQEQLFRLIQSIPSPKAEPFKMWMARVAAERLDQIQDP